MRRRQPLRLEAVEVDPPPGHEAQAGRALSALARVVARATLRARCSRCGRYDSVGLPSGTTWGHRRLCEVCAVALDAERPMPPESPDPGLDAIVEGRPS